MTVLKRLWITDHPPSRMMTPVCMLAIVLRPTFMRMNLTVTTWNINSVRLRIDLVAKFIKAVRPDVLCLQETKCPDDKFPLKRFKRLGYEHIALNGQKGYHGVAVISRLPFESFDIHNFCGKSDCRHVSAVVRRAGGPARRDHVA